MWLVGTQPWHDTKRLCKKNWSQKFRVKSIFLNVLWKLAGMDWKVPWLSHIWIGLIWIFDNCLEIKCDWVLILSCRFSHLWVSQTNIPIDIFGVWFSQVWIWLNICHGHILGTEGILDLCNLKPCAYFTIRCRWMFDWHHALIFPALRSWTAWAPRTHHYTRLTHMHHQLTHNLIQNNPHLLISGKLVHSHQIVVRSTQ